MDEAHSFKKDCVELKSKTEKLSDLLLLQATITTQPKASPPPLQTYRKITHLHHNPLHPPSTPQSDHLSLEKPKGQYQED
ncbi:Hypothetical predicted protein, partial [Prunus dulcis]